MRNMSRQKNLVPWPERVDWERARVMSLVTVRSNYGVQRTVLGVVQVVGAVARCPPLTPGVGRTDQPWEKGPCPLRACQNARIVTRS